MKKDHSYLREGFPRGFSLIEVVFATLFLTLIVLGVVRLESSNLALMGGQRNELQAHFLANQGAQIAKALGYGALNTAFSSCDPASCFKRLEQSGNTYGLAENPPETIEFENPATHEVSQRFQRRIQIVSDNTNLPVAAYKIRSIVEWEDATGSHTLAENAAVETNLIVFQ